MRALLAGELRRVWARRLVKVILMLAATAVVVAATITFFRTHALSDAALQARVEAAQSQFQSDSGLPPCPPGVRPDLSPGAHTLTCVPSNASFVRDPRFHLSKLKPILEGVTAPFIIVSCLIGASVIGADWQSRTLTTVLTWEARRARVLSAKVLACIIVAALITLAGMAWLGLLLTPVALVHGTTAGTDGAWWQSVAGVLLRAMAMSAIVTTIGFSIASMGRNTAAALGALFAYIVVIENVVGNFLEGWRRWLVLGNSIVFVSGRSGEATGVHGRSVTVAGLYLAAVALGLFAAATAIFARRDVA